MKKKRLSAYRKDLIRQMGEMIGAVAWGNVCLSSPEGAELFLQAVKHGIERMREFDEALSAEVR